MARKIDTTIHQCFHDAPSVAGIAVLFAGTQQCPPGHSFQGRRDHFVLHYVVEGSGRIAIEGQRERLHRGDAFFIFPEQKNRYQASHADPWRYHWVGFTGTQAENLLASIRVTPGNQVIAQPYRAEMDTLFDNLARTLCGRRQGFEVSVIAQLLSILSSLFHGVNDQPGGSVAHTDHVERALGFIASHYHQHITVAGIAAHLGLHRSYFSELFHRATGSTVQDYLVTYRMERAKELLTHTGDSVSEIANSVGYVNYFSFLKGFKAATGSTPSEYRERFLIRTDRLLDGATPA